MNDVVVLSAARTPIGRLQGALSAVPAALPDELFMGNVVSAGLGQTAAEVEPLSLDFYRGYTRWFQERQQFNLCPELVQRLDRIDGHFVATLESGEPIAARSVVPEPLAAAMAPRADDRLPGTA